MGVTETPWPKEVVASSTGPTLSNGKRIPFDSPFKSTPVRVPKPNDLIYLNNVSFPIFCPICTKPGLLIFDFTSKKNNHTHHL